MKTGRKVIAVSVMFGLLVGIIDAVLDCLFFYEGTFLELLITNVPPHELYIRTVVIACFLIFGVIVSKVITERKKAEQDLEYERSRLAKAQEIGGIGTWELDIVENVLLWTQENHNIFGVPDGSVTTYEAFLECVHPDDREYVNKEWMAGVAGKPYDIEHRIIANGKVKWVREKAEMIFNDEGKVVRAIGVTQDITERKRAEEALKESERVKSAVLNNMAEHVIYQSLDMEILWANKAAAESIGLSSIEELAGRHCYEIWQNRNEPCQDCPIVKARQTNRPQAAEMATPDGKIWLVFGSPVRDESGKVVAMMEVTLDITKLKRAENALRIERNRAQKYLDVASVILLVLDSEGKVSLINKEGCRVLGYDRMEIIGHGWFDKFLPVSIRDEVRNVFEQLMRGQIEPVEYFENAVLTKTGQERLIAWHNIILTDESGKIIGTLTSGQDITERKQAEEKLLTYQEQLRSLASELLLAEERLRRRMAINVHDHIGQKLAISKIKIKSLCESVSSPKAAKALNEVGDLITQTIESSRSLTFELSPPVLYELGFEAAVEWLVRHTKQQHGLLVKFKDDGNAKPLDDNVRVFLFQAVRELLVNVVKHAQASHLTVSTQKVNGEIQVDVEDDGIGFDVSQIAFSNYKASGFGLFSIRERLDHIGGGLKIESGSGSGTKATLTAPLDQKSAKGEGKHK